VAESSVLASDYCGLPNMDAEQFQHSTLPAASVVVICKWRLDVLQQLLLCLNNLLFYCSNLFWTDIFL